MKRVHIQITKVEPGPASVEKSGNDESTCKKNTFIFFFFCVVAVVKAEFTTFAAP
jgi:hypothetical protein